MTVSLGTDDEQQDLESFAVLDNGHIDLSETLKVIQSVGSKLNRVYRDNNRIVYQDDDVENEQALLVEVLPAGNFERTSTRTIIPNKTLVW